MFWMLFIAEAVGAVPPEPAPPGPAFELRACVEQWDDPFIGAVYSSGGLMTCGGLVFGVLPFLNLDIEGGYDRVSANEDLEVEESGLFQLVPLSVVAEWPFYEGDPALAYVGLGPTMTVYSERWPGETELVSGMRPGLEARLGGRIDTGLVQRPRAPAPQGLSALELHVYGARRIELPAAAAGFELGAWRVALGVGFRL